MWRVSVTFVLWWFNLKINSRTCIHFRFILSKQPLERRFISFFVFCTSFLINQTFEVWFLNETKVEKITLWHQVAAGFCPLSAESCYGPASSDFSPNQFAGVRHKSRHRLLLLQTLHQPSRAALLLHMFKVQQKRVVACFRLCKVKTK